MPRKKSAVPHATRVRENQRRSRARRKELIEDLQKRLREYEKREIQATMLVQLAARKVAWENTQLRGLLATKGVFGEDIEQFLHGKEPPELASNHTVFRDTLQGGLNFSAHERQNISPLNNDSPISRIPHLNEGMDNSTEPHDSNANLDIENDTESEQHGLLPPVSGCSCPVAATQTFSGQENLMLEMSCETAAIIIAGMRGHGDEEQARLELGCSRGRQCNVKNIKVLQVMERE
ncbi:uncharacterized protein BDR25DRAFT_279040 [Lindgomyces ingoldianus]|uniref:Uncharacterized protein n=1 Tax=Lindgomyces ingoldianus TaxID=673940 RepID=A0ACB6R775_9PLEO|nr:uncharacterized protein BDR25DRAFT_279040 [Lindgomyces ingoldianus]KAF2475104.1 hypothetical protein BDR25DRAFT_279040 [Lindgomyces ingoldianus]